VLGLLLEVRTSEQLLQQLFQLPSLCDSTLGSQMFDHLWLLLTWIEVHKENLHEWDDTKAGVCLASEHILVTDSCKEAGSLHKKRIMSVTDKSKKKISSFRWANNALLHEKRIFIAGENKHRDIGKRQIN
jgi:hypothetical protein